MVGSTCALMLLLETGLTAWSLGVAAFTCALTLGSRLAFRKARQRPDSSQEKASRLDKLVSALGAVGQLLPRVPLPVKLFLSYTGVLVLAMGPVGYYVSEALPTDVLADTARQLGEHTRRIIRQVAELPPDMRLDRVRLLAQGSPDRITYLSPEGEVLFDTVVPPGTKLENHASRPEVRQALGDRSLPNEDFAGTAALPGAGMARRVSATSKIDTLYVAIGMTNSSHVTVGVLRLAKPISQLPAYYRHAVQFVRNAAAIAVSLAILFSLLAALAVLRPLNRLRSVITDLSAGDMSAKAQSSGNDEVGELARAINEMTAALRRKLLASGAGEQLLGQLVEHLPYPCVVFSEAGELVTANGPGLEALLGTGRGPAAAQPLKAFAAAEAVQAAVATAEYEGEPVPISGHFAGGFSLRGFLHVLKRPGLAPLRVFFSTQLPQPEPASGARPATERN